MIQLIQITEEKLTSTIVESFKAELEKLKTQLQQEQPTEWISRNDVSKMLGVSYTTLYSWNRNKILIPYTIGNRVYYKREDVNNALTPKAC